MSLVQVSRYEHRFNLGIQFCFLKQLRNCRTEFVLANCILKVYDVVTPLQ